MKIILINGSNRKNGATYHILNELRLTLLEYNDIEIEFYNVSELNLKYCIGCSQCYEKIVCKTPFSHNPLSNTKFRECVRKSAKKLYKDITSKRKHLLQEIKRNLIFKFGILPFVQRKGADYMSVLQSYKIRGFIT